MAERPTWDEWLPFCVVNRKHECWPARNRPTSPDRGHTKHRGEWVHRLSFEMFHGYKPVVVDHLCERQACANPFHLDEVGSHGENAARHFLRRREATCPSGHEWTPENTYVRPNSNSRVCRACRREGMRAR